MDHQLIALDTLAKVARLVPSRHMSVLGLPITRVAGMLRFSNMVHFQINRHTHKHIYTSK